VIIIKQEVREGEPVIKADRDLGKQPIVENPVMVIKPAEGLLYLKRKRRISLLAETAVWAKKKNNQYTSKITKLFILR
jgi:hypothetical protein